MKSLLLLLPLLFATSIPPGTFRHTLLPRQFTARFSIWQECELAPPSSCPNNELYYLDLHGKRYMKAHFAQSVLLPGEPARFKDSSVWWYVTPDPDGVYRARVYNDQLKQWALVAENLGPPRRDMIVRFYKHNPKLPQYSVPAGLPAGARLSHIPSEWFFTSGNKYHEPASKQGYFAVRTNLTIGPDKVRYKLPLSLVGGGAGTMHQAYGQLIYDVVEITTNLTPADFTLPSGYKEVTHEQPMPAKAAEALVSANCAVCHYKVEGTTTLYQPEPPQNPPTIKCKD